jgi:cbb3-type cytochrome oxidase subunit 3
LSGGAIGGVVAGVIIFFVLLIAVIVWIVRGKRQRTSRYNYAMTMDDDTDPLYFDSDPTA